MTIHDLQKFLEAHVSGACVPVDLLKIANSINLRRGPNRGNYRGYPTGSSLTLVVDAECCLDRLYGGFFSDWVCGGQWNRMIQFLAVLSQTVQNNNIELAVFFNGALEQQRLGEWVHQQNSRRKNINSVLKHVALKGTPPPKVWWVAPIGLRTCLRMALRHLNIQVVCTMDDHHQEVIAFCRENNYHGLMAEDAEYIIFDPPRYFSSHHLKLTYKGSLETKEFILDEVAKGLNLPRNYFCLLAALLGNYLLTEYDLLDFYDTLIPGYDKNHTSQEELIHAVVKFVTLKCDVNNLITIGAQIFGSVSDSRVAKFKESVQYFLNGTKDGFLRYKPLLQSKREFGKIAPQSTHPAYSDQGGSNGSNGSKPELGNKSAGRPCSPQIDFNPLPLPPIPHEVTRTASERHQKGLMCPWIYQVLNQGEVKFEPCMQDEMCREFPNVFLFYQPIRQFVYAILFNLHHHNFMARKAKEEGLKPAPVPEIVIREWIYTKDNPYRSPNLVEAAPLNWAVPTIQRLWFGSIIDDKKRRLRAFLSCLHSDSPLMLHTSYVPQHMLIMATVLRFILSYEERPLLTRQELDAFLVTAFSTDLTNAPYLQDLQVHHVTARGVQLASFFMAGVETALFANDACGAPVPWLMCCPWLFFDGKLFHTKLLKGTYARHLAEVCDGDMNLVSKVKRCREAILEGLYVDFLPHCPNPMEDASTKVPPPPPPPPPQSQPSYYQNMEPPPWSSYQGPPRARGGVGGSNRMYSRGGQLQVAGVVVGSWGPNFGSANENLYGHSNENSSRGKGKYPSKPPAPARGGRPAVLAKRKGIKRKETKTKGKDSPGQTNNSISNGSYTTLPQENGYPKDDSPPHSTSLQVSVLNKESDELSPYATHATYNGHGGLKSPDSGVNVSILE